jgi:hypothetical protein
MAVGGGHDNGTSHIDSGRLRKTSLKPAHQTIETTDQIHFQKNQMAVTIT